jgi:hypothetical protein
VADTGATASTVSTAGVLAAGSVVFWAMADVAASSSAVVKTRRIINNSFRKMGPAQAKKLGTCSL